MDTYVNNDRWVGQLAGAIVLQAADDYRDLKKRGKQSHETRGAGDYSVDELTEFFRGEWCSLILKGLGSRFRGRSILLNLRNEPVRE